MSGVTRDPLEELERQGLPTADPVEDARELADYLRRLPSADRAAAIAALPRWLESGDRPRQTIALPVAVLLKRGEILDRAVALAEAHPIGSPENGPAAESARELSLLTISVLTEHPTERGLRFLRALSAELPSAKERVDRERAVIASVALASIEGAAGDERLRAAIEAVRRWGDSELKHVALRHASLYYLRRRRRPDALMLVLRPDEFESVKQWIPTQPPR